MAVDLVPGLGLIGDGVLMPVASRQGALFPAQLPILARHALDDNSDRTLIRSHINHLSLTFHAHSSTLPPQAL